MRPNIKCAICGCDLAEPKTVANDTAYVVCANCLPKLVQLSQKELYQLAYPGGHNGKKPTRITL